MMGRLWRVYRVAARGGLVPIRVGQPIRRGGDGAPSRQATPAKKQQETHKRLLATARSRSPAKRLASWVLIIVKMHEPQKRDCIIFAFVSGAPVKSAGRESSSSRSLAPSIVGPVSGVRDPYPIRHQLSADLIVAAGAFDSTELLNGMQRCRPRNQ